MNSRASRGDELARGSMMDHTSIPCCCGHATNSNPSNDRRWLIVDSQQARHKKSVLTLYHQRPGTPATASLMPHENAPKKAGQIQLSASNMAACRVILLSVKFSMMGLPVQQSWLAIQAFTGYPSIVQTLRPPHSVDDEDERDKACEDIFRKPRYV